jgi:hypothetical protein
MALLLARATARARAGSERARVQRRTIALSWRGEIAIADAAIVIMRIDIDATSSVAAATIILLSLDSG